VVITSAKRLALKKMAITNNTTQMPIIVQGLRLEARAMDSVERFTDILTALLRSTTGCLSIISDGYRFSIIPIF
jgi:hypothetical protein